MSTHIVLGRLVVRESSRAVYELDIMRSYEFIIRFFSVPLAHMYMFDPLLSRGEGLFRKWIFPGILCYISLLYDPPEQKPNKKMPEFVLLKTNYKIKNIYSTMLLFNDVDLL